MSIDATTWFRWWSSRLTAASGPTTSFAAPEGTHHLHHWSDRRRDIDACDCATPLPRGRKSEKGDFDIHQFPGRQPHLRDAIYDTMRFIRPPVSTMCVGQSASIASLLLAAGTRQMRFALPNACLRRTEETSGRLTVLAMDQLVRPAIGRKPLSVGRRIRGTEKNPSIGILACDCLYMS
jgi:hypothetical protein